MTILEWMKAKTRYNFEDTTFQAIAIDREITDTDDASTLTVRDKELLTADILFTALVLSPSSTSSFSASHNNFQKKEGGETITAASREFDMRWMKSIYAKYADPNYDIINSSERKIKLLSITDEI